MKKMPEKIQNFYDAAKALGIDITVQFREQPTPYYSIELWNVTDGEGYETIIEIDAVSEQIIE